MRTVEKIKNPNLMEPIRKHWYLCLLYLFFSYALTQILVLGSSRIADATDSLFAGDFVDVQAFMLPFIILMLLGGAAAFGKSYSKNTFSIAMQTDMRNMLVNKLVKIRTAYFDKEGTGALMNKLLSDMYQIEALFAECIPEFLVAMVTITTVCAYIGIQSIRLLVVTVICYPLLFGIANRLTKMVGKVAAARRQLYDDLENSAYDVIQGILVGKTFNLYELQKKRIFGIADDIVQNESHRTKVLAVSFVMGDLIRWIPKLICYLFCLYEVGNGRMTIGMIFAYVMLLDQIARPMGSIPGQIASIREYGISVKRLQEVLDQEEEVSGTGDFAPEGEIVMELAHVNFGYSEEKRILEDVSLSVRKGSSVAFVGNSGGGKSTVMKILCGFYYPQEGQYRIYGHEFKEWDIGALRKHISLVSQDVFLFPDTIAANVAYGKPGATMEEIVAACKKANIHDFIAQLPQGYETEVGERGAKLSGGQKQRISIARAFLKDAPILLLDEPTSAVDVETEQGIQEVLKEISRNRTVITIAHRLNTIADADEIYVFENGKIVRREARTNGI
ncbi:MAG: ABC transporter ATP-binding protein/permease [Clostridium sp.]|nr:ABC transporter ATP-binding protein/permease [Acetatifactor muris]MCM1528019.1 ABC transporter ATP-binding protein/permease [Bacteroides sp.]MCM1563092.1 ABC transporter ATP-binding protein/permease [Clostridium sp.]